MQKSSGSVMTDKYFLHQESQVTTATAGDVGQALIYR